MRRHNLLLGLLFVVGGTAHAAPARQTEADGYTRYELLEPERHDFRITYEITATTPGATAYYNPIRPGSTASDERVSDRATGKPLPFTEVGAAEAIAGGVLGAKPTDRFIAVKLAHPVTGDGGGARVLIEKTYADAKSYYRDGETIVFDRSLGIKRNAVVLPAGYELVACNYPSQILQQPDGRIAISFWNTTPAAAPLLLRARRTGKLPVTMSSQAKAFDERAHQNRNIVYYLLAPESHSFALTHDYTETKPGTAAYVNIVRTGSRASNPSARNLDTGAALTVQTIKGEAVRRAEPEAKDITDETEAVVFPFAPVKPGESLRLRIAETYTDPARYGVTPDGELFWHRSFGRADDAVVLPQGWVLTNSSVPATVTETPDKRIRLDFLNPRNDEIDVVLTARRREAGPELTRNR